MLIIIIYNVRIRYILYNSTRARETVSYAFHVSTTFSFRVSNFESASPSAQIMSRMPFSVHINIYRIQSCMINCNCNIDVHVHVHVQCSLLHHLIYMQLINIVMFNFLVDPMAPAPAVFWDFAHVYVPSVPELVAQLQVSSYRDIYRWICN